MLRFGIAALLLLIIVRVRRIELPSPRRIAALAAMGGIGYVGQSYCYFSALQHADASTVALLLYLYPALVAALAAVFLHERLAPSTVAALVLSLAGTSLVVGAGTGEPKGIALAVGAAFIYSVYITVGSRVIQGAHPLVVALTVCTAAATVCATAVLAGAARGREIQLPESAPGWVATAMIAVVCTVIAIVTFFSGMQLLGPTRTAVLSTLEPVVTAVLAVTLLSQVLSPTQIAGGVLVIAAVIWQATHRHPGVTSPRGGERSLAMSLPDHGSCQQQRK
ncbi:MAG: EamA family transporter [Nocardioides sp.]|nr:EamA family transporter [Nocardioides sp.]